MREISETEFEHWRSLRVTQAQVQKLVARADDLIAKIKSTSGAYPVDTDKIKDLAVKLATVETCIKTLVERPPSEDKQ